MSAVTAPRAAATAETELEPVRVEAAGPKRLAGRVGTFTPATLGQVADQWRRFATELAQARAGGLAAPPVTWGGAFGLFAGREPFECLFAVEARTRAGLPPGWRVLELPSRRYAVFAHPGHVGRLGETVRAAWSRLPTLGVGPGGDGGPEFLERFGPGFDPATGLGDMEVWIPIPRGVGES